MNNRFLLIAISVLCSVIVFFSCEPSTESNDTEPPKIMDVTINRKDTIVVVPGLDTLYLNTDTLNTDLANRIDTIVLGHRVSFHGRFTDNEGLTSYKIIIDTVPENKGKYLDDAVLNIVQSWTLFGVKFAQKDTIVNQQGILTTDFILAKQGNDAVAKNYPVRQGDYLLKVCCVDKAGNQDSLICKVKLLTRETILKNR